MTDSAPIIQVENVTKAFGDVVALADVSLTVARGEVVGLLGPNGAGKTTLVRVLSTLLVPDSGHATVGGLDVVRDAGQVRRQIGLAGQAAAVDELLTAEENLRLVGRLYGLAGKEAAAQATRLLERFGLTDAAHRRVRTYSGGMRRRLDLCATLMGSPSVLLLDEPTAGLDPASRNELWRFVDRLAAEGTTVVLTSQYLEEVERLASRIVVIDRGRLIADGSAADLKSRIGGDLLEARVLRRDDLESAISILTDTGDGALQVNRLQQRVAIPTTEGTKALVVAGQRLEEAGVALSDLAIRRPSLDDVFFSLTGATGHAEQSADEVPSPISGPTAAINVEPGTRSSSTGRGRLFRDTWSVTRRYLTRLWRTPPLLFFATVQPVLFVVGLSAIFAKLVEAATGGKYIQYLIPGVLVMNIMLAAGGTGTGIAEDMQAGIIDRFRSLPMARPALLAGRTLSDLTRNAGAMAIMLAAGFALGFRLRGSVLEGLAAFAVALLFGYAWTWVFATVGLAVKDVQAAQFAGFAPVLPLVFLSGAWIPVKAMSSGVQVFARNQPVNVAVEAVRSLIDGTVHWSMVWQSLAWSIGMLVVFVTLALRLYEKATA